MAFAVCVGGVQAGPVRTARNAAKDTAITARNVAHSVVKGTRRAVHGGLYVYAIIEANTFEYDGIIGPFDTAIIGEAKFAP